MFKECLHDFKEGISLNFSSPSNLQTIFPVTGHTFRPRFRAGVFSRAFFVCVKLNGLFERGATRGLY